MIRFVVVLLCNLEGNEVMLVRVGALLCEEEWRGGRWLLGDGLICEKPKCESCVIPDNLRIRTQTRHKQFPPRGTVNSSLCAGKSPKVAVSANTEAPNTTLP